MKASIISVLTAAAAVQAGVVASSNDTMVTSTILTTQLYTVTSCAPTVTNCPVGAVTSTVMTTTTVCPVTAVYPPAPPPTSTSGPSTSTIVTTQVYTISSCAPTVTNCPYGSKTSSVVTSTIVCGNGGCVKTLPPSSPTGTPATNVPIPPPTSKNGGSVTAIPPPASTGPAYCASAITSYITVTAYPCPGPQCVATSKPSVPAVPATTAVAGGAGGSSGATTYACPGSPSCPAGATTAYVCPGSPYCPASTAPAAPYGTAAPSGGKTYNTTTPVPFTGGASAQKAGGLLMAVGVAVAALL